MRRGWMATLRVAFGRRRFEDEMAEELRFHLETRIEQLVARGVSLAEAERLARRELGGVDRAKEQCRKARGLERLDEALEDLRLALRRLARTPGFTTTAIATLALCWGANLTIFAVVDAVLLRPLPFPDARDLVTVYNSYPNAGIPNDGGSVTNYFERRGAIAAFSSLSAYREGSATVSVEATEREPVLRVSADFFATLGVAPVMGRVFTEAETRIGADRVVIVSNGFWRQRLGGDPAVLGRALSIDGRERIVVGVLAPEFVLLSSRARLILPLATKPEDSGPAQRHAGSLDLIARLAPGATVAKANQQIAAHDAAVGVDDPDRQKMLDAGFHSVVAPLQAEHVAAIRPILWLTQLGGLVLLAVGLVNLLNLLLLRAAARAREVAIRQAIGAGRRHAVVDVLLETTLLVVLGGVAGLLVAAVGVRTLGVLGVDRLPLGATIGFDARLAAVALGGALLLGLVLGLIVVAVGAVGKVGQRTFFGGALSSESRGGTASRSALRLRDGFVVAQVALAFVLLAGAGLLGASLRKVTAVDVGFRPERVLSARLSLVSRDSERLTRLQFLERLANDLARRPDITAVGFASNVPLSGESHVGAVTPLGLRLREGESPRGQFIDSIDGDAFAALGISLREGRFLDAADSRRPERVCVVDEAFARRTWPRGRALGQRLFEGPQEQELAKSYRVVGVVGTTKQRDLAEREALGAVYFPLGHRPEGDLFIVVRTTSEPAALATAVRAAVRALDPQIAVADLRAMDERVADSLVARRSPAMLATVFSIIALLLTAIGTYGVASYAVSERRREIAVRVALGELPAAVRRRFAVLALRLVGLGIAAGLLVVWVAGDALAAVLFEVSSFDGATLSTVAVVLAVVSLAACIEPTQRAARIPPREILSET